MQQIKVLSSLCVQWSASAGIFVAGSQFAWNQTTRSWTNVTANRAATAEEAALVQPIAQQRATELSRVAQEAREGSMAAQEAMLNAQARGWTEAAAAWQRAYDGYREVLDRANNALTAVGY
jgi:hypothetical protein